MEFGFHFLHKKCLLVLFQRHLNARSRFSNVELALFKTMPCKRFSFLSTPRIWLAWPRLRIFALNGSKSVFRSQVCLVRWRLILLLKMGRGYSDSLFGTGEMRSSRVK